MSLYQKFNMTVSPASSSRVSTITAIAGPKRRGQLPLISLRNLGLSQLLLHNNRSYRRDSHKLRDLSLGDGDVREKRLGYCYDFDGVDDYVDCGNSAGLQVTGPLTLSTWIKASTSSGNNGIVTKYSAAANSRGYGLFWSDAGDGRISFIYQGQATYDVTQRLDSIKIVADSEWHFVTAVYVPSVSASIYIDAISDANTVSNIPSAINNSSANFKLGTIDDNEVAACLYGVRIYNDALTPEEITHLYTNGQSGTDPGTDNLVAHYPLQEEAGTTAYDISGNGHHGTIVNAVTSGVGSIHQPDAGVVKSYANDVGYSDRNNLLLWAGWTIVGGSVPARKSGDLLTLNRFSGGNSSVLVNGVTISNAFADKRAGQLKLTIQSISGPTAATHLRLDISGTTHRLYGAGTYYINLQDNHSIGYVALTDHSSLTISELEFIGPKDAVFPYVPASTTTHDAVGGALTVKGRCPNDGLIKSPAWQGNGVDIRINVGEPVIPENDDCEILLWFKTDVVENSMLLTQAISFDNTYSWFYLLNTGNISVRISDIRVEFNGNYADGNWHSLRAVLIGSTLTVFYDDKVYSATGTKVGVAQGNLGILYRTYIPNLHTSAQVASVSITTGGVTTTYVPIEGTRNVAKLTSDGSDTRIITDAVVGGTLETLYTLGDGSWRHPVIENGGRWDGTSLIPADPLGNCADGNPINIQPHTHPRGLLLDRTGGVVAPIDYQTGTANHTEEEYNDIPAEVTLNKRGLSIYAADRYGASLADIQSNPAYQILVKTDNAGTSNSNQFTLPATGTYTIDWGDGTVEEQTGAVTHTYSVAGEYVIKVTGGLTQIHFNNEGDRLKLLEIQNWGDVIWSTFLRAWRGCSNMDITATDLPNSSNVTTFSGAWNGCSSLTSFPLLDSSNVTTFDNAWYNCSSLTSFPSLDSSNVTDFSGAWFQCATLTSFPFINTSKATSLRSTWLQCYALRSFPLIDTSNVTDFRRTWDRNFTYDSFPVLSFEKMTLGGACFAYTTLPTETWTQLLINTEATNQNNNVEWHGGSSKYSAGAAATARAALVATGWSVTDGGITDPAAYQILVKTDNTGTSTDTQFTLPATGAYTIDWGDGTVESKTDAATHTYASAGEYVIKVTGGLTRIRFNNGGDKLKLLEVQNWGDATWSSFSEAYFGCANCLFNATDALVLPTDCSRAFQNCTAFNQSVANWNTAEVTNMAIMFAGCTAFNQSVANFNTAKVASMGSMFSGCANFNQSVANWNTAAVTNMPYMFSNCTSFNQSVANFNTAEVTDMAAMFNNCTAFKQPLATFSLAGLNGTTRLGFFASSTNINATDTTTNYDETLIAWAAQLPLAHGFAQSPNFGTSKYSTAAVAARAALVDAGWSITDGGEEV